MAGDRSTSHPCNPSLRGWPEGRGFLRATRDLRHTAKTSELSVRAVRSTTTAFSFLSWYEHRACPGEVAGLEVLASVRIRAEVRDTTVYASANFSVG